MIVQVGTNGRLIMEACLDLYGQPDADGNDFSKINAAFDAGDIAPQTRDQLHLLRKTSNKGNCADAMRCSSCLALQVCIVIQSLFDQRTKLLLPMPLLQLLKWSGRTCKIAPESGMTETTGTIAIRTMAPAQRTTTEIESQIVWKNI